MTELSDWKANVNWVSVHVVHASMYYMICLFLFIKNRHDYSISSRLPLSSENQIIKETNTLLPYYD